MAYRSKYQQFNIVRFADRTSVSELHEKLEARLDEQKDRRRNKNGHLSLFKLSMLSREARRNYRPPAPYEMQTRSYDQKKPTWDPYHRVSFDGVGAMAFRGCLMIKFDAEQVGGDLTGALHAAKISTSQIQRNFTFEPHMIVYRYDESSLQSMDQLYEDEAVVDAALRDNPINLDFSPATITGARTMRDRIDVLHVFTPKHVA